MDTEKLFHEAHNKQSEGDWDGAEKIYTVILDKEPDHGNALHMMGLIHFDRGDAEKAIPFIEKSLDIFPNVYHWTMNFGKILKAAGRLEESINAYQKAISLNPESSDAVIALADLYYDSERFSEALFIYYRILGEGLEQAAPIGICEKYINILNKMGYQKEASSFSDWLTEVGVLSNSL